MSVTIPEEVARLFNDPDTTKVIATVDEHCIPHLAVKQSLQVDEQGRLLYTELLESSRTNRNLVRSLWFGKSVSVIVRGAGDRSWQVKGRPVRTHITGPLFRKHYQEIRAVLGDVDVAAVWVIEPEEVIEGNYFRRRDEEERRFPYFNHLDRLAKPTASAA